MITEKEAVNAARRALTKLRRITATRDAAAARHRAEAASLHDAYVAALKAECDARAAVVLARLSPEQRSLLWPQIPASGELIRRRLVLSCDDGYAWTYLGRNVRDLWIAGGRE